MRRWLLPVAATTLVWAHALDARAETCLLFEVTKPEEAALHVFFTRFAREDNTDGRYRKCRRVSSPSKEAKTFFVTPFRQDANVIVLRENWPGP